MMRMANRASKSQGGGGGGDDTDPASSLHLASGGGYRGRHGPGCRRATGVGSGGGGGGVLADLSANLRCDLEDLGLVCSAATGCGEARDDFGGQLRNLSARTGKICNVAPDRICLVADTSDGAGGDLVNKLVNRVGSDDGDEQRSDGGVLHPGKC